MEGTSGEAAKDCRSQGLHKLRLCLCRSFRIIGNDGSSVPGRQGHRGALALSVPRSHCQPWARSDPDPRTRFPIVLSVVDCLGLLAIVASGLPLCAPLPFIPPPGNPNRSVRSIQSAPLRPPSQHAPRSHRAPDSPRSGSIVFRPTHDHVTNKDTPPDQPQSPPFATPALFHPRPAARFFGASSASPVFPVHSSPHKGRDSIEVIQGLPRRVPETRTKTAHPSVMLAQFSPKLNSEQPFQLVRSPVQPASFALDENQLPSAQGLRDGSRSILCFKARPYHFSVLTKKTATTSASQPHVPHHLSYCHSSDPANRLLMRSRLPFQASGPPHRRRTSAEAPFAASSKICTNPIERPKKHDVSMSPRDEQTSRSITRASVC